MDGSADLSVELIPIERVNVINPRVRNRKTFEEIVDNIGELGLKRPVTVSRGANDQDEFYHLVCGQGRLEAYQALGQQKIPAIIVDASTEDCLVMSLVENCARRKHRAIDLLQDIEGLKRRGYTYSNIARKIGLNLDYVKGVAHLLEDGEHRLLRAVESGHIPISVAVQIADAKDDGVQNALQQAYEAKLLRGRRLLIAKNVVEQRRRNGKGLGRSGSRNGHGKVSSNALLRAYREDADKKRLLVHKAEVTRDQLVFVTAALTKLFSDENFVTLLRAEGLDTLPRNIAERIQAGRGQ